MHGPGQFTGEVNTAGGSTHVLRAQVSEPGEVIEIDHGRSLALVQTDSEISEILMRAFILRRAELIAHGLGDAIVIGSSHCAGRCASRNSWPATFIHTRTSTSIARKTCRPCWTGFT